MTDEAVRIEFSDRTMIETDGDYMSVDMLVSPGVMSPWMVRTVASVSVADVYCEFVLNFRNDKRVVIAEYRGPYDNNVNPCLHALREWCELHGWERPEPSTVLLESLRVYDYWQLQYESGLISCEQMRKREMDLIERMSRAKNSTLEEE